MTARSDDDKPWYDTWLFNLAVAVFVSIAGSLIVAMITMVSPGLSQVVISLAVLTGIALVGCIVALAIVTRRLQRERAQLADLLATSEARYERRLRLIGVREIAEAMGTSQWSPSAVMGSAHREVRFLGVFGHKWVLDAESLEKFRIMLTRIQLNGGRVQFLLLDPDSAAAEKLAGFRKLDKKTYKAFHSVERYKEFAAQFDCFELRLYDNVPFIRVAFVDGLCSISRFKVNAGAEETLKAPQLVFGPEEPEGTWTLYQPFVLLFDLLWSGAADPFVQNGRKEVLVVAPAESSASSGV